MFFEESREHFFRPLVGKYRAHIMECLRELYKRLYSSSSADYGQALQRENLIEIFQEALVRAPELASGTLEGDDEGRFHSTREQASWVLNQLLEHGWLEKQVDQANLQSTFAFTRYGRTFAEPFASESRMVAHTRHRNTRNVRNSLASFLERGDVYDLLDAYENSEHIISDFTDVISELEERKRDLVKEMEQHLLLEHASQAFFDFMENRFQPDVSVRLSADNVEKHRDHINQVISQIRKSKKRFKADAERRLRELLPELAKDGQSILWHLLDGIEMRLRNASEIMLPALRKSLQSFTKRADIIIRQMSYLASQQHNDVLAVCKVLADMPEEEQGKVLEQAGEWMSVPEVALVDPAQVRLTPPRQRHIAESALDEGTGEVDQEARKELFVQQVLDQAFFVNHQALKDYIQQHLPLGKKISSRDLPINSANDFLAVSHAISLGAPDHLSSEFTIRVDYDPNQDANHSDSIYFLKKDHFTFELVQKEA